MGYLMPKPYLQKIRSDLTRWRDIRGFIPLKGIDSKVNEIERPEFELAYFYVVVQYFRHFASETSPGHIFQE